MIYNILPTIDMANPLFFILNFIITFFISTLFLLITKPDIVIVSVPGGDSGLGFLFACNITGTRSIADYRDEWEDFGASNAKAPVSRMFYRKLKRLATKIYNRCELVVATTSRTIQHLKYRGVQRIQIIPNGADLSVFTPREIKSNKLVTLVYVGAIISYYRVDIAVLALAKLIALGVKDIRFIIVGDGNISRVLEIAREQGIEEYIEYKGVLTSRNEVADVIRNCDLGLIPYDKNPLWKNTIPVKLFEYCSCGVPVVVTALDDSLLANLVKQYGIGRVANPMNIDSLAAELKVLIENIQLRTDTGHQARAFSENYDRTKISDKFLRIILSSSITIDQ
jgi:glycosyltransferase involved in cell wall biosynthesis